MSGPMSVYVGISSQPRDMLKHEKHCQSSLHVSFGIYFQANQVMNRETNEFPSVKTNGTKQLAY